jgi:hypothetical protein
MNRRRFIACSVAITAAQFALVNRATAWVLITGEEAEKESKAPQVFGERAQAEAGAPKIVVEEPDPTKPIKAPITIRIKFEPQGDAKIDPSSFRATYGFFALDITQRIIENAKVTTTGIVATNANIPPGRYSVTLQIADNKRRVGVQNFNFTVT